MNITFQKEGVDFTSFEEMYIQNIDLREMTASSFDDEEWDYVPERLDNEVLNKLAIELYEHFFINLKDSIIIKQDQEVVPEANAIILNLKLKAEFRANEQGALVKWVLKMNKSPTDVFLECEVLNAQDNSKLLVLKDSAVINANPEEPFVDQKEYSDISDLFRVWAVRFSIIYNNIKISQK